MGDRFYQQQGKFRSKAQRRGYLGITPLRKKLRKMPGFIGEGIRQEVQKFAVELEMDAKGWALLANIVDSREMVESISYKISGRKKTAEYGVSAIVGPGADHGAWQGVAFDTSSTRFSKLSIKGKKAQWNFMKGYWAEFGVDPHNDRYTYTNQYGQQITVERDHPGYPDERPFMQKAWDSNYPKYDKKIKEKVSRALEMAAEFY